MDSLLNVRQELAKAMDLLRQRQRSEFQQKLIRSIGGERQGDIADQIAVVRQEFADEFIEKIAVRVTQRERPNALNGITAALRQFQLEILPRGQQAPTKTESWQPGIVRTLLGAAFGAAAALALCLLVQAQGNMQPAKGTGEAAVSAKGVATQAPAAAPSPAAPPPGTGAAAPPQAPPGATPPATPSEAPKAPDVRQQNHSTLAMFVAVIAAAVGAAVGAFIVVCPPVHRLLHAVGWGPRLFASGGIAAVVTGAVAVAFRGWRGRFFTAGGSIASIVSWIFGWLTGYVLLLIFFALFAVVTIALLRWTAPSSDRRSRAEFLAFADSELDKALRADTREWSAVGAALISAVQAGESRLPPDEFSKKFGRIRETLATGRAESRPPERTLRLIEQIADVGEPPKADWPDEFVWRAADHDKLFSCHGVVRDGDIVELVNDPLFDGKGKLPQNLIRPGTVTRKR